MIGRVKVHRRWYSVYGEDVMSIQTVGRWRAMAIDAVPAAALQLFLEEGYILQTLAWKFFPVIFRPIASNTH